MGRQAGKGKESEKDVRCELAAVSYEKNILGNGPRKMTVVFPELEVSGRPARFAPVSAFLRRTITTGRVCVDQGPLTSSAD